MADLALRTQADVLRLPPPQEGESVYFDEGEPTVRAPGLALRIRSVTGSRRFVFFYRHGGRQLKMTIGDATAWKLDKARDKARELRVEVDKGKSPAIEKAAQRVANELVFA